jgi:XTP/dITP diphosphohydrolase
VFGLPDGREASAEGTCEGQIALAPRGSGGFGYDPVFVLQDGRTMAELKAVEKDEISHRGKALRAISREIERLLKDFHNVGA